VVARPGPAGRFDPITSFTDSEAAAASTLRIEEMASCAFSIGILHLMMPLVPTPSRLKRTYVWPMEFLSGCHFFLRFGTVNSVAKLKARWSELNAMLRTTETEVGGSNSNPTTLPPYHPNLH
jgi:hypothetical protein